jgi:hypothetical protein
MEDKVKDGGAAFPSSFRYDLEDWADPGMSLRDWFAGQALTGLCANVAWNGLGAGGINVLAIDAYSIADAMLAAREPTQ